MPAKVSAKDATNKTELKTNVIYGGDCIAAMNRLPENSVRGSRSCDDAHRASPQDSARNFG